VVFLLLFFFFFQAEDGIRDVAVTGVQTCALPILFLRSNARSAGLTDRGQPMQATYVAALEGGRIAGVAAHCWNGMVLVQAPEGGHAAAAALEAVRRSRRTVTGFSGPWDQVVAARAALGLAPAPAAQDSRDELYVLHPAPLVVPPELASGALRCRHPAATELELLVDWRMRFAVEALGATDGPDLRQASADDVRLQHERGTDWLLLAGAAPVRSSQSVPRSCCSRTSRSEEHTSELQSRLHLVCRLLLEKKNKTT